MIKRTLQEVSLSLKDSKARVNSEHQHRGTPPIVLLVMDALDECLESSRADLLAALADMDDC
jgi:hypothetical protein